MRWLIVLLLAILLGGRALAEAFIDWLWWKEMGQEAVWWSLAAYGWGPVLGAGAFAAAVLWVALARGLKSAESGLSRLPPPLARGASVAAVALGFFLAMATVSSETVMRWAGHDGSPLGWVDPVFGHTLDFYFFQLPFWRVVLAYAIGLCVLAGGIYWFAARGGDLESMFRTGPRGVAFDVTSIRPERILGSVFLRSAGVLLLLAAAARVFLNRYQMLFSRHGFLTGVDWVDEHVRLPLTWALIGCLVAGAAFVWLQRWRWLAIVPLGAVLLAVAPAAVSALYVRPNEIGLERPYIERHIQATRSAYGIADNAREADYAIRPETRVDPVKHRTLVENVRLWDWRAFHDTITQIQALRPYYVFPDSDVDRYRIDGQLKQLMISPRELDIRQLPDAQRRWINPHFVYTHGYGLVAAEASRITPDGLPRTYIEDAPPRVKTASLKLTRPEIYYGESTHEPVYVRSGQQEFSYPSGDQSVFSRYEGKGGFPASSWFVRLAAALREGDFNIMLTNLVTPETRMMIRRDVGRRVNELAEFVDWDADPYLVIGADGRLVWIVDGYTTSNQHPYSETIEFGGRSVNYLRNSVKATVDAYHGTVRLFVADERDPVLAAYRRLFPSLFEPLSAMPPDLREHLRYPETLFRAQAAIYRVYHMLDPQAFYNKEDVWDVARSLSGNQGRPTPVEPAYVVTVLPGETEPEFVLLLPFTPRGKDNLVGMFIARCDGDKLGQLRLLRLSKQELVFGPMQVEARIDQDPEISKDLSLWNQKGSQVLRGRMLALPIDGTILYVEPIYIQSSEARMPQLQKVVVANGNDLIYRNTYEEALAALGGLETVVRGRAALAAAAPAPRPGEAKPADAEADRKLGEIRQRLQRYRELWSQGKYGDAGRELEAVERLAAPANR